MKYVKTRDQLYEETEGELNLVRQLLMKINLSFVARDKVRAKWLKRIIPDMHRAMQQTLEEIPKDIIVNITSMSKEDKFTPGPGKIIPHDGDLVDLTPVFLNAKLSRPIDNYFQDMIDDYDLEEQVEIEIKLKPPRTWLPDPKNWLVFPGKRGRYNVEYHPQKDFVNDNQYVFTTTEPNEDPVEILADAANATYLKRNVTLGHNSGILQIVAYGQNENLAQTEEFTYEEIFTDPGISNKSAQLERKFSLDLDEKLIKVFNKHMFNGEYFVDMLRDANIRVTEYNR